MSRHPQTEQYLIKGAFKYQYKDWKSPIPFAKIDMKLSAENPARFDRKIEGDRVLKYGIAMESGDEFPAIVLLNHPNPYDGYEWIVATGMHRLEAMLAAGKSKGSKYAGETCDAYLVIEPNEERRETLIRQLNSLEGKGTTTTEEIAHIIWLHEHFGKPLAQYAKEWNHKLSTLQTALNVKKARARGTSKGWDYTRAKVSQDAVLALGTIQMDPVFDRASEVACSVPGFGTTEVKQMVQDIKKERDQGAQLAIVQKYEDEANRKRALAAAQKARPKAAKIYGVMTEVKKLANMLERSTLNELHVGALEDKPSALLIIDATIESLKKLRGEVEHREKLSRPPASELRRGPHHTTGGDEAHP